MSNDARHQTDVKRRTFLKALLALLAAPFARPKAERKPAPTADDLLAARNAVRPNVWEEIDGGFVTELDGPVTHLQFVGEDLYAYTSKSVYKLSDPNNMVRIHTLENT